MIPMRDFALPLAFACESAVLLRLVGAGAGFARAAGGALAWRRATFVYGAVVMPLGH
jgi:hypothetical protein